MLHQEGLIAFLYRLGENTVVDQAPVDIQDLIGTVPPADGRLTDPSLQGQSMFFIRPGHLQQVVPDIPAEYGMNDIRLASETGSGKPGRGIHHEFDTDMGIGQGKPCHIVVDIPRLRLRAFQELSPGRGIVEQIPHDKGAPLRRADLFKQPLISAFDLIPDPRQVLPHLCNQLYAAYGADAGKRLPAEPEGADTHKVFHLRELGCRMTKESTAHLGRINALPIVRNPDHGDPAVTDLNCQSIRARVQRVFTKLLYNRARTLNDLTCGDLVDGCLLQYMNLSHEAFPPFQVTSLLPKRGG